MTEMGDDSWLRVFRDFKAADLANLALVSKGFHKLANHDALWSIFAFQYFGYDADKFKGAGKTYKEALINHDQIIRDLLNNLLHYEILDNIKELEYSISTDGFTKYQKHLLKELQIIAVNHVEIIQSTRDFVAALLAQYSVCLSTVDRVKIVAQQALNNVARSPNNPNANLAKKAFTEGISSIIVENSDWRIAKLAVYKHARRVDWKDAGETANNSSQTSNILATNCIDLALSKLSFKDSDEIEAAAWKLTVLSILASLKREYCNCFDGARDAAIKKLHSTIDNISKQEILTIWAQDTWKDQSLSDNPHIVALKSIVEAWRDKI